MSHMLTQQEVVDALTAYLERGEREQFERVLEAIRAGQVVVEISANRMSLIAKTHPLREKFAARLSQLRSQSGLAMREIVEETEISHSAVHRNLNGQAITSWPIMALMIRTMGGDPKDYRADYDAAREERWSEEPPQPRKRRL
jgi:hypothetical protein